MSNRYSNFLSIAAAVTGIIVNGLDKELGSATESKEEEATTPSLHHSLSSEPQPSSEESRKSSIFSLAHPPGLK